MMKRITAAVICMTMLIGAFAANGVFAAESTTGQIYINEICTGNKGENGNLADELDSEGKYCDWIELYNPGDTAVELNGWGVTDKPATPFKSTLTSGVVPAGGYLIVYCSKNYAGDADKTVAAINLSGDGETVLITSPDAVNALSDTVEVPALVKDTTYSRVPDGSDKFLITNPTPGEANKASETIEIPQPVFSHASGMYDEEFLLTLTNPSGGDIYYTLNSTDPTDPNNKNRKKYTAPIRIYD